MHLAIVRRGQFATFDMLARGFAADPNIRVIWDRRVSSRRRDEIAVPHERRRSDRRQGPNALSVGSNYLLLAVPEEATPAQPPVSTETIERAIAAIGIETDVECAVRFDLPLLLTGGDEAGRIQLAEFIHNRSIRRRGPFVIFAASPAAGGRAARWHAEIAARGIRITVSETISDSLDMARFGTLFVADVALTTAEQQNDLVHFFTNRAAYRGEIGADARVITATDRDLLADVAAGRFRSDLFYYMNVLHLSLPSHLPV